MSRTYRRVSPDAIKLKALVDEKGLDIPSGYERLWQGRDHHKAQILENGTISTGAARKRIKKILKTRERRTFNKIEED